MTRSRQGGKTSGDRGVLSRASDRVATVIRQTIVEGELAPGDLLPPERTLAERFKVTRNTVREALRQLEQLRLVSIRQGSGVRVRDYRDTAGLDFLAKLLVSDALGDAMRHDVLEVRAVVGRAISCHAVERFDLEALPALREAVEAFTAEAESVPYDPRRLQTLDFDVHARLIAGAGNLALVMMYNSLRYLCERIERVLEPLLAEPRAIAEHYQHTVAALEADDRHTAKHAFEEVFLRQWPAFDETGASGTDRRC